MANKNNELQSLIKRGVVKQVPPEEIDNKLLWTDGSVEHWYNAQGKTIKHDFSPSMRDKHYAHGHGEPKIRGYGNRRCRILMAVTFYGFRPTFTDRNGKPYVAICHHLVPNLEDYSAANLLCWLTRPEHIEADRRQRALRKLVPDGNLYVCSYDLLRALQDPRTMPVEDFEHAMDVFRFLNEQVPIHWQTFKEVDYLRWFFMPFEEFKAELIKGLGPLVGPEQMMKESFYDKE